MVITSESSSAIVSIEKEIEKITVQLDELLGRTEGLTHKQLNFKPSHSDWSILQVFQHLIAAETHTNIYLRKKILAGKDLKTAGVSTKIKSALLRSFMYLPFKFKAPAAVDVIMDEEYDYGDRVIEWKYQRNELISFLGQVDDATANKLLFKHGSGIRMNLVQMLKWTYVHADRHSGQIERIINHAKFPA